MKYTLLILLFASCGYAPMTSEVPMIVNEIETASVANDCNCLCNYYGANRNTKRVFTLTELTFKYTDSCGTFQIGDTLKIITP